MLKSWDKLGTTATTADLTHEIHGELAALRNYPQQSVADKNMFFNRQSVVYAMINTLVGRNTGSRLHDELEEIRKDYVQKYYRRLQ